MKSFVSTAALIAAIAALAIAGSTSDSFARGKAKAKPAAACTPGALKTAQCGPAGCSMQRCWGDGKWYPSLFVCATPFCPK